MSAPAWSEAGRALKLVQLGVITEDRACQSKVAYYARNHAKASAKEQQRKGRMVRLYRCPFGDHWHLTKTNEEES